MSVHRNKEVVLRFFEDVCNGQKTGLIPEIFSPDVQFNGTPGSPREVQDYLKEIKESFENPRVEVNKMIAEEDWVSTMRTWTGIQKRDYNGYAATNKPVTWTEISVVRLENGKIKDDWVVTGKLIGGVELSDRQKDFLVKDYELKARYLTDQLQRMWTRFNFFVTIESALIGSKLVFGTTGFTIEVACVGLIMSFIWYVMGAQDRHLVSVYRKQLDESGRKVGKEILNDNFYLSVGYKPKATVFKNLYEWYIEPISITRLAAWIPFVLTLLWLVTIVLLLKSPSPVR